jgi:hypothetical protein
VLIWLLSSLRLLGTIGVTAIFIRKSISEFEGLRWVATTTWFIGAAADVLIAVPLTLVFAQQRRETDMQRLVI